MSFLRLLPRNCHVFLNVGCTALIASVLVVVVQVVFIVLLIFVTCVFGLLSALSRFLTDEQGRIILSDGWANLVHPDVDKGPPCSPRDGFAHGGRIQTFKKG